MVRLKVELSLIAALALAPLAAAAQTPGAGQPDTGGASIGASVVVPISIVNSQSLEFGGFLSPAGLSFVAINPNPADPVDESNTSVTFLNSFSPPPRPATFDVSGEANATYLITINNGVNIVNLSRIGGGASMSANMLLSSPSGIGQLDTTGAQPLHVGANLGVGASQQPGTYQGQFTVSVQYQ